MGYESLYEDDEKIIQKERIVSHITPEERRFFANQAFLDTLFRNKKIVEPITYSVNYTVCEENMIDRYTPFEEG